MTTPNPKSEFHLKPIRPAPSPELVALQRRLTLADATADRAYALLEESSADIERINTCGFNDDGSDDEVLRRCMLACAGLMLLRQAHHSYHMQAIEEDQDLT